MDLPPECIAILFLLLLCALGLHVAGIYCLQQEQCKLKKQKIILLNLSTVEIVLIVFTMGHLSCAQFQFKPDDLLKANQVRVPTTIENQSLFPAENVRNDERKKRKCCWVIVVYISVPND